MAGFSLKSQAFLQRGHPPLSAADSKIGLCPKMKRFPGPWPDWMGGFLTETIIENLIFMD